MNPHLSSGVFNQTWWPGNGGPPYDDCWTLADMMAVHAVAPWVSLPTVIKYRAAAGNPDAPGVPDGGTIAQSAKAIRALWPEIGKLIHVISGGTWDAFKSAMGTDKVCSLSVLSGSLPQNFGFKGNHRVAVAHVNSGWLIANPLAPPHSRWRAISEAEVKKAIADYPGTGVRAIVMPSVAAAFKTHPLA